MWYSSVCPRLIRGMRSVFYHEQAREQDVWAMKRRGRWIGMRVKKRSHLASGLGEENPASASSSSTTTRMKYTQYIRHSREGVRLLRSLTC